RQAVDDDAGQVGPMLSELLGMPCVSSVAKFELNGETATVERDVEGGREIYEVGLPAVLTTDKGLNEPRYASLKGIMAAKKKPIDEKPVTLEPAGLEVLARAPGAARGGPHRGDRRRGGGRAGARAPRGGQARM